MATDLTNINISDSYKGLIHANGASLPSPSIQQPLYDGSGQKSSLSIGVEGVGASISGPLSVSGQLSAGAFTYPVLPATNGYVLTQVNSTTLALTGILDILRSTSSNYIADGTYSNVQNITVTNGLITAVTSTTAVRTFFCDLETFNDTALSAAANTPITNRGIYPYGTSNVTANNVKPILIRNNYLNKVWGSIANNSNSQPMYGIPNIGDVAIVIFSDPVVLHVNYVTAPQMWGIKYVWKGSEWIWERYLAASGPIVYTTGSNNYNTGTRWSRTFQVNNQFSSNGNGPNFGVYAIYTNGNAYSTPVQYT